MTSTMGGVYVGGTHAPFITDPLSLRAFSIPGASLCPSDSSFPNVVITGL